MEPIKFSFSVEEVNVLLKGLSELPAKESYKLINDIYRTVEKQCKAESSPEEAPTKD